MRKREFFIVIILILIGVLYNAYEKGEVDIFVLNQCSMNPKRIRDKAHPVLFPQEEITLQNINALSINNMAGEIKVTRSPDDSLTIQPVIIVYHKNRKDAEKIARSIGIKTNNNNGRAEIFAGKKRRFPYKRVRIQFNIQLPENLEIELYNRYGDIEIAGTGKNIYLNCRHGNITAKNLDAPLKIHHRFGIATLEGIRQPMDINSQNTDMVIQDVLSLKVHCSYVNMSIKNVEKESEFDYAAYCELSLKNSGKTRIEARQSKIKLEDITGGLKLNNSHNSVRLKNITGDVMVTTRNCKIEMKGISAEKLFVSNNHGDIDMEDISLGEMETRLSHGNLDLSFIGIEREVNINNDNSDIMINFPNTISPSYNIELKYGKLINKTTDVIDITKDEHRVSASKSGGVPGFMITNSYGDIILRNSLPTTPKITVETEEFQDN